MEDIQLNLEFSDISKMSKEKYKLIANKCNLRISFQELILEKENRKSEHAKGKNIIYEELSTQTYLMDTDVSISLDERKWLFKRRTDNINIGENFKWKHEICTCISCKESIPENTEHLFYVPF